MAEPPKDTFLTIRQPGEGLYKEKGSKFFGYVYPAQSEAEIKALLEKTRAAHHASRHVCYAWKLGPKGLRYRANDDGEPGGTAGKPILGQIDSNNLTNVLVMVVRYFGGVKLGVGGLITAYRAGAAEAIAHATIEEKIVEDTFLLQFDYPLMNEVMRIVKAEDLTVLEQNFETSCAMHVGVRQSKSEAVFARLDKILNLEVKIL